MRVSWGKGLVSRFACRNTRKGWRSRVRERRPCFVQFPQMNGRRCGGERVSPESFRANRLPQDLGRVLQSHILRVIFNPPVLRVPRHRPCKSCRLPAGYSVGWSGFIAWTSSRAVAVGFKTPLHLGWIPVIEDDLHRYRQAEGH